MEDKTKEEIYTLGELEDGFHNKDIVPDKRKRYLGLQLERRNKIAEKIVEIILAEHSTFYNAISILEEAEFKIKNQKIKTN
ncbi:MAG: hypothetical protein E7234_06125 [Lachnospiraceae bacterium]|nr:hypothetical protein [Lachnospiraceae bacterium]